MEKQIKKRPGRPTEDKDEDERSKSETVSLRGKEKAYLIYNFGSLTKAIRTLLPKEW